MAEKGRFLHIFADESRQTAEKYMVLGGVIISRGYQETIQDEFRQYRDGINHPWEFKWKKFSPSKLEEYRGFVDILFDHSEYIHFKSIVVDNSKFDRRLGDKELGFYKMMYQFLLHSFGKYLQPDDRCIISLDRRKTKYFKLSTLYIILNRGINKKYKIGSKIIRFIQAVDSKDHDLIQLADIVIGAIGYEINGLHRLPDASPAKIAIARHISRRVGLINLQRQTPRHMRTFSIWHFRSKKG